MSFNKPTHDCCEHCIHWETGIEHPHWNPCSYIVNLAKAEAGQENRRTCQS